MQLRISCSQDPQHVVTFAPNYYSFTSIGTNELPPEIAGAFSPSGQITQAVTPSSAEFYPIHKTMKRGKTIKLQFNINLMIKSCRLCSECGKNEEA